MVQETYCLNKMNEIGQGDQTFVNSMLVTFVENVSNALEKIKILKLDENWVGIAEISHKLASNFAYLESKSLQAIASDIEKSVLNENNLIGIADKTEKLCKDTSLLVEQLKKDFDFLNTN